MPIRCPARLSPGHSLLQELVLFCCSVPVGSPRPEQASAKRQTCTEKESVAAPLPKRVAAERIPARLSPRNSSKPGRMKRPHAPATQRTVFGTSNECYPASEACRNPNRQRTECAQSRQATQNQYRRWTTSIETQTARQSTTLRRVPPCASLPVRYLAAR